MATDIPAAARLIGATGLLCLSGIVVAPCGLGAELDPSVLAPTGTDVRVGDLQSLANDLLGGGTAGAAESTQTRKFTLTPSIAVQELATDNVYQIPRPRVADLVTSITPQLTFSGQSTRVQANVTYNPEIQLYAETSQQDQVAQQFSGQATLTAIPDTLFLDLRAYGAQQSTSGNYGPNGAPFYSSQDRTDTMAFKASPYLTHRFDGWGTVQAGYVLNYSSTMTSNPTVGSPLVPPSAAQTLFNDAFLNQGLQDNTTRSNEEYASFTTGENFGRSSDTVRLDATQFTSTGDSVLSRAHRNTAIDDFGYGITRSVAVLGRLGYEDILYSGLPAIRVNDLVWGGGARITPNQASSLTVMYGHADGLNSFTVSASYAVTARLRVFANYSEGLTSSPEELQDNLDSTTVDQYGNTLSTATGAPTLVADQLLGLQNDLYRLKRFSATAVSTYARDTFALTLEQETRNIIASGTAALPASSDQGVSGSLSWSHQISPTLTGSTTLRYALDTLQTSPSVSDQTINLDLQASYAISPSLSGTLEYYVSSQNSNIRGQNTLQNAAIIGLRKSL